MTAESTGSPSAPRRARWWAPTLAAGLVALVGFAYAPALDNGFVNYDDELYILGSHPVRAGLDADGVAWAFTTFQGANWFPLTRLSWMLDAQRAGLDPRAFHATSVALHALAVALLFAAWLRATGALWPSAFVAAVFAVHPLHVESVAWASARKDVLSGVFWAASLLAWVSYRQATNPTSRRLAYACVFTALALGLMAKPTLVVLPFVLLLIDVWPLGVGRGARAGDGARPRAPLAPLLVLWGLAVAAALVTWVAQREGGAVASLERIPLSDRLSNAVVAVFAYLRAAVWPSGLSAYYPHPMGSTPGWIVALAASGIVALSVGAWLARRRAPYVAVGWLWFLGCLAPVIGIVQVGQAAFADRYAYLSLGGVAVAVAWTGAAAARRGRAAATVVALLALATVALWTATTRAQVRVWRDSESLFEHALSVTERNHVAHINLGVAASNARRYEEARDHLVEALRIAPGSAKAQGVLGDASRGLGEPEAAAVHYRAALEREPGSARWLAGLGGALLELGRTDEAISALRDSLAVQHSARVRGSLGLALFRAGRRDVALVELRRAVEARPDLAELRADLGVVLLDAGDVDAAVAQLDRAVALDPQLARAHAHLGLAISARDGPAAGLPHLDAAAALDGGRAFAELGAQLALRAGDRDDALARYRVAVGVEAPSPSALNNLAWLLATTEAPGEQHLIEAAQLAERAVALTGRRNAAILDTLAQVYIAQGRRDEANRIEREAAALAEASDEP